MKPVYQTVFDLEKGNCLEACIASILNLSIDDIPYFDKYTFMDLTNFLEPFGLYCLVLNIMDLEDLDYYPGYFILVGRSVHVCNHAVIYKANKLVHDPHPRNVGLKGPMLSEDYYQVYFFVQREIK